ncbi:MAG: Ig-like domain-containing protein, partial [Cyanobacteria bacterium P01_D01_bin.73]
VRSQYNHVLTPPVLQSVSSVEGNGTYSARTADSTLSLTFTFDQSVNFTANGGALEATLNNGAIARLTANASGSTLTVNYPIGSADQSVADLSVSSLALTGGATLANAGAEAANLALPSATNLGNSRNLEIDNRSILAGDIALTPAGNVPLQNATLTVNFGDRLRQTNGSALGTDLTNSDLVSLRRVSDNATVPIQRVTFDNTGQQSISVVPSGTLDPSTTYRVEIAGNRLEDDGANELTSAVTRDFVTLAGDATPPRVNFVPGDGSTVTDLNSNLTVEFSEPVRIADNNRAFTNAAIAPVFTLAEFNSSGSPIANVPFNGVYDEATRRVTLDPVPPLNPNSTYRLELRGNVLEDFADNAISTRTINFTAQGNPVQFPSPQVSENPATNTFSVAPLTDSETTIAIAPSISPQTQVTLPVETNGDRRLRIDLESTVGNVALSGPAFQGDLSFALPRPLSSQRGNLALDFSGLGGSGDREVSIRNRNFSGTLELNLPDNNQDVALNFDDFEARTEVNLNGDDFTGDVTVVVPLGLTDNAGIRRRFNVRNFDGQGQVLFDGRRTGLAFEIDSETPVFGQLGAGGDIVRLTGAVDRSPGVSPLGLGDGGDFFEDRRRLSSSLSINGNGGNDVILGSVQSDRLNGGQGNDRLLGNGGDDLMGGDLGNDHLFGNTGNDQLNGGGGDDLLQGGRGNDTLTGGTGNDVLMGELGDDVLIGGVGQDQFVVMPGSGNDVITDFDPASDAIALGGGLTPASVTISALDATTTRLEFTGGSVTLQNLAANTVTPTTLFS